MQEYCKQEAAAPGGDPGLRFTLYLTNHILWITRSPWFYKILNQCRSLYGLQRTGPTTMSNNKKIQETVRLRDTTSPVYLTPGDACHAMWERIHNKDLHKDHKDLNWLRAHQALPVRAWRQRGSAVETQLPMA
ncbi:hypothetical protein Y1Q_0015632 [Alligator mississippiensis]|uniref:Uncharacterized protein n=1 Tax=Alligator mississippiensis TaxID=8496 RepID=A0A151NNH9_ALLMI|nr:hypothetical protein Y1Q_0015632 [Alligator mississippiensis]